MEKKDSTFQKEKDAALVKVAELEKLILKEEEVELLKAALLGEKPLPEEDEHGFYQALIVKERRLNDQLVETRKAMIDAISALKIEQNDIGIRRMGEIDGTVIENACKMRFTAGTAEFMAPLLCSKLQAELQDPLWHPFKTICHEGVFQKVVDDKDEKLHNLKIDLGETAQKAVIEALKEMDEYNPSVRTVTKELWNFKEGRKATLAEGVQKMQKRIRQLEDEVTSLKEDIPIAKRKTSGNDGWGGGRSNAGTESEETNVGFEWRSSTTK